jgi:hypothetical protein
MKAGGMLLPGAPDLEGRNDVLDLYAASLRLRPSTRSALSSIQGNHAAEAEIQKICAIELRSV